MMERVPKITELTYRCKICGWLCTKKTVPELTRTKTKTGSYGSNGTPTPTVYYDEQYVATTISFLSAGELVTNGDMELDANWNDHNTPGTNERSSERAHGGTYSRKFVSDGVTFCGIKSDVFTTVTSVTYDATVWVYPDSGTVVKIAVFEGDGVGTSYETSHTGLTQGAWNEITFSFTEASGGASSAIVIYDGTAAGTHTWYVDDVSVKTSRSVVATENNLPEIKDSANGFADKHFRSEQPIKIATGSGTNDGTYTINARGVSRGTLTLSSSDSLTTEKAVTAGEVTISDVTYEPTITTYCPMCGSGSSK